LSQKDAERSILPAYTEICAGAFLIYHSSAIESEANEPPKVKNAAMSSNETLPQKRICLSPNASGMVIFQSHWKMLPQQRCENHDSGDEEDKKHEDTSF